MTRTSRVAAAMLLCALVGCAQMQTGYREIAVIKPEALGAAAGDAPWPQAKWWDDYGDPGLTKLIEQSLTENPGFQAVQTRIRSAEAAVSAVAATRMPSVEASADATTQRFTENGLYPPPYAGSVRTTADLQVGASWELDLFGRRRAELDSAIGMVRTTEAGVHAARNLLAIKVAQTYMALARLIELRELAVATQHQREQLRELVELRRHAGLDTRIDKSRVDGSAADAARQVENLEGQIAATRDALAALVGQGPQATANLAPALSAAVVQRVPERIPADLLSRRADVVASRWAVEAARSDVDVAKAEFYPNINLVAFAGFSSIGLSKLLESGSRVAGVGPAVHLPIFEGGRLRANLTSRQAALDSAIAVYNATLVQAVREVADALASSQSVGREQAQHAQALAAAQGAYDLAQERYRAGLSDYLAVLGAQAVVLDQRRVQTDLRLRGIDAALELTRALGGGYHDTETTSQTTDHAAAVPRG